MGGGGKRGAEGISRGWDHCSGAQSGEGETVASGRIWGRGRGRLGCCWTGRHSRSHAEPGRSGRRLRRPPQRALGPRPQLLPSSLSPVFCIQGVAADKPSLANSQPGTRARSPEAPPAALCSASGAILATPWVRGISWFMEGGASGQGGTAGRLAKVNAGAEGLLESELLGIALGRLSTASVGGQNYWECVRHCRLRTWEHSPSLRLGRSYQSWDVLWRWRRIESSKPSYPSASMVTGGGESGWEQQSFVTTSNCKGRKYASKKAEIFSNCLYGLYPNGGRCSRPREWRHRLAAALCHCIRNV